MNKTNENKKIAAEAPEPIDLIEILYALKKRALILLAAAVLGGLISGIYTKLFVTPLYTSTSMILVLSKDTTLTSIADLQFGSQLANDYKVLVTSRPVMEEVIEELDLSMSWQGLKNSISINNPESTRLLEISVKYADPEMAKKIVDEVSYTASEYIGEQMEVVPPKIIEEGVVSSAPVSPNVSGNIVKGILAGLVLAAAAVVLLTMMDDTIKSEEDIEKYLEIPMFASVPDRKDYISGNRGTRKKRSKRRRKSKWQIKKSS